MKLGVFTPLLSELPLDDVLSKLSALGIHTVELGTGNYPGDAHCKLSMLATPCELNEFSRTLERHGAHTSALSCNGNPLLPTTHTAPTPQTTPRHPTLHPDPPP